MVLLSSAITASCDKPFGELDLKLGKKIVGESPRPPLSNHDPARSDSAGRRNCLRHTERQATLGPKAHVLPAGSISDSGAPGSTYRAANKRTFTAARQCTNQRPGPGPAPNHFEVTLFMRSALHKYAGGL